MPTISTKKNEVLYCRSNANLSINLLSLTELEKNKLYSKSIQAIQKFCKQLWYGALKKTEPGNNLVFIAIMKIRSMYIDYILFEIILHFLCNLPLEFFSLILTDACSGDKS